jgi:hypothetical protein
MALLHFKIPSALACIMTAVAIPTSSLIAQVGGEEFELVVVSGTSAAFHGGRSVDGGFDVNGDSIPDLLVGAIGPASGALPVGQVSVYSGLDGSLIHCLYGENHGDIFGFTVAFANDVDGDQVADLVIGVPGFQDAEGNLVGKVSVYSGATASLIYELESGEVGSGFGGVLATVGDVDGDGLSDILVGAPLARGGVRHAGGAALLYSGAQGTLIRQLEGGVLHKRLGTSVSGAGDVDNDGLGDYIIGTATTSSAGHANAGSALVYSGQDGRLLYEYEGSSTNEGVGFEVAGLGDLDGDGHDDFAFSRSGEGPWGMRDSVGVFICSGATGGIIHQYHDQDLFEGASLDIQQAGDVDGDAIGDFLIGVPDLASGDNTYAGAAHLFSGATGQLMHSFMGDQVLGLLGAAVCTAGDIDGDGRSEVIVCAPGADVEGLDGAGSVAVFAFDPLLSADTYEISASTGGAVSFGIDFPDTAAGLGYRMLVSASGYDTTEYGVEIPLTADNILHDSYLGSYPGSAQSNMQGTLDIDGNASASITIPANLPAGQIGRSYWFAVVLSPVGSLPIHSSISIPVTVVP